MSHLFDTQQPVIGLLYVSVHGRDGVHVDCPSVASRRSTGRPLNCNTDNTHKASARVASRSSAGDGRHRFGRRQATRDVIPVCDRRTLPERGPTPLERPPPILSSIIATQQDRKGTNRALRLARKAGSRALQLASTGRVATNLLR